MIIEAQDAFKGWLTAVLKPMCEADPAALAKYVIALIKKDKTEEELQKTMKEQLLIFLQDGNATDPFVSQVFNMLGSKEYITNPVIPNANPPNPVIKTAGKEVTKDIKNGLSSSETSLTNEPVKKEPEIKKDVETKRDYDVKRDREYKKSDNQEKDDKPVRRRSRHRSLSRNRTRSRSRSWDRTRRSPSPREKSRERDQQRRVDRDKRERVRPWRNKSPPRRYERRRTRTPSPVQSPTYRPRSRSRSPRHQHRNRYRNRTPPRSGSNSRSRSPAEKRERGDSTKDKDPKDAALSRPSTPTQDSNHGNELELRLSNSSQSIQRAVAMQTKRRCRDFDERGYCMRGDMCPFDHGVDPVVLEDTTLTSVLTYNPNGTADVPPAVIPPVVAPGHPMMGPRLGPPEYNPQAPQMWNRGGYRGPRPMGMQRLPQMPPFQPQNNMQRELISVPVLDSKKAEPYGVPLSSQPHPNFMHGGNMDGGMGFKKKNFDYNRLGPRTKNPINCSLELKKVPPGLNSITHLNNHFSRFGKIVNIQVNFDGDLEAALITFSSHAEANAAYRSTEAVLNNRFIKVFWHNNAEGKQENVPPPMRSSIKDRLGNNNVVPPNSNKVLNLVQPRADNAPIGKQGNEENEAGEGVEGAAATGAKLAANKEEVKAQEVASIKKGQELLAAKAKLKKSQMETKKEAVKSIRKRTQDLLDKQLSSQKMLIEKLEKLQPGSQREEVRETIKKMQVTIETLKKELEKITLAAKSTLRKKTKEETQKEMLDIELDLIAKQQEGADTTELQKKIRDLKARASLTVSRGRGMRGRRYTPVSRHLLSKNNLIDGGVPKGGSLKLVNKPSSGIAGSTSATASSPFQKHAVDHRPTTLLISGYETDEQDAVMTFFKQFGEIIDHHIDSTLPSVTVNYKTRKEAEMALLKGKHFQDRTLTITWCNSMPTVKNNTLTRSSSRTVLISESEEDQIMDQSLLDGDDELVGDVSEEVLLHDDEEEEEENEDRSWRR